MWRFASQRGLNFIRGLFGEELGVRQVTKVVERRGSSDEIPQETECGRERSPQQITLCLAQQRSAKSEMIKIMAL